MKTKINVLLDEHAIMPTKAHKEDAGYDLYLPENIRLIIIPPFGDKVIDTGVHFEIPSGYVGFVKAKSGLSVKSNIEHGAGVIDSGYTGSVSVHLYNHGNEPYAFLGGEKLAQIVFIPVPETELVEVSSLEDTERGSNGFGSSGK